MTQFEKDVFARFDSLKDSISALEKSVVEIKDHLDADYSALHGNGKPGLLVEHQNLEKRVHALEIKLSTQSGIAGKIVIALAWLVTTAIAFYNLFRR
jgi:hypothetical protein